MIKVPFDTEGNHGASVRGQTMTHIELEKTLDNAYKTMDWFKYLADNAKRVEVLGTTYRPAEHVTTTVVGFELEGKHETYYRLKYNS
jgi:hypothetical protein